MSRRWQPATVSGVVPDGLWQAFWQYENALMANDLATLASLFAPGPKTLRADADGVRVGHDAITAFGRHRGGAGQRVVHDCHVRMIDAENAVIVATSSPGRGGRGVVTQWWTLRGSDDKPEHWVIAAAQVAAPPAVDGSVWRVVGAPLVRGEQVALGSLRGETVAVKDLFAVAGFAVGAGVPAYLAEAPVAASAAAAVAALLAAGADVAGIAQTDEFAYSIAGRNGHYGTPANVAVPGAIPGGSSSGPATAVALGQASIGLGTDTAGSIRVPASYQGLWGLRSTHGAVDRTGLLPLAPRFDAVGWLTRSPGPLRAAAAASLDPSAQIGLGAEMVVAPEALGTVSRGVRAAFEEAMLRLVAEERMPAPTTVELPNLSEAYLLFRTVGAAQAWQVHGSWVCAHPGSLSPDVAARFSYAESVTAGQHARAAAGLKRIRAQLDRVLAGRVLLIPSTASFAPALDAGAADLDAVRTATLTLTCLAAIGGYPALSVPALTVDRAPVGLGVIGPRLSDLALVDFGRTCAEALHLDLPEPRPRPD